MSILFNEQAKEKLLAGASTIAQAVKSTMGPGGRTVIIDSKTHSRGLTVTKDGITVAKAVYSEDPTENLAIRILREASENTANNVGDGTSSTIAIAQKIVEVGFPHCKGNSTLKITRAIQAYSEQVIAELEKKARKVGKKNLEHVATISANGDRAIGKIIADTYKAIGVNGAVLVDKSPSSETYAEVSTGIKFDRGLYSQLFVNNQFTGECHLDKGVLVLLTDIEIPTLSQIDHIIRYAAQVEKPLLIVAPVAQAVIAILGANFRNGFKFVPVEPPSFGYKQTELMSDLAVALGTKFYSKNAGDNLELIDPTTLGLAHSVKISKDQTVIEPAQLSEEAQAELDKRISEISKAIQTEKKKDFLRQRLSFLNGKVATIFVGADSEVEQKEKIDRVDDAICATRSALEEGILPGGGSALQYISLILDDLADDLQRTQEQVTALNILSIAISEPFETILENAEIEAPDEMYIKGFEFGTGVDATTGEIVNTYEAGIIDPLKVTKNALRNAVSVAVSILSTSTTITQ